MLVSIITVSFNSENTIEETIKSVLSQTYTNIEYIIIDGQSSDGTYLVAEKYKSSITHLISEPDNGIYDAMNKGIKLCTGDIIGILNSDDIFFDNHVITRVVSEFQKTPTVDCVYGNIIFFDTNKAVPVRSWVNKPYFKYYFELGEVPAHPALFIKKEVYNKIGLYKTNFTISADQEFILRMLKINRYKSSYINEYLVRMRVGGVSTRGLRSYMISTMEIKRAWNSNGLAYPFWLYFLRPVKKIIQLIRK